MESRSDGASRSRHLILLLVGVAAAIPLVWWRYRSSGDPGRRKQQAKPAVVHIGSEPGLRIRCPLDGSVFPPDLAKARFHWEDTTPSVDRWKLTIEFAGGEPMQFRTDLPEWSPPPDAWETIKRRCAEAEAVLEVCGVDREHPEQVLSRERVTIRTSRDEVGAPIFYREVNLPFIEAVTDPAAHIRWRFGAISSPEQPPVVLDKLPLCGNCHSFSGDGSLLGMDVDYGSDKGSYVLCPVSREMVYDKDKIITWSDYKPEGNRGTLGLLSRVSPDGRYVISTVEDRSVFTATDELAFSQLFFPIQGILAYYDRQTETFHALPGADDPRYVQSNPTWSPDGKTIVFARSKAYDAGGFRDKRRGLVKAEEVSEFVDGGQTFKYDLYRIPFNGGQGGKAEPLRGASNNGKSNYFPKYSPDGKWIVFCQARSFMLLQPDSELFILPAEGGRARRLQCNTSRMNSWHSWSPNGKWLVFSSKAYSPYTQLFLTHVDADGRTSPPVVLSHFTSANMAANIPEFVNTSPEAIYAIREEFIDDQSYVQAGRWNVRDGEYEAAVRAFRAALEINPDNIQARVALAAAMMPLGKLDEAKRELQDVLSRDETHIRARCMLGNALEEQGRFAEALKAYRRGLQFEPESALAYQSLGSLLFKTGAAEEGKESLLEAARLDPDLVSPYVDLGNAYLRERDGDRAVAMFRRALERDPQSIPALLGLAVALMHDRDSPPREIEEALQAARKARDLTAGQDAGALTVLAEAYAAAGRWGEAHHTAHRALNAALDAGRPDLAATAGGLLKRLKRRRNRPPGR